MFYDLTQKRHPGDWSDSEALELLIAACTLCPHSIYIFIDGLDEIASEDALGSLQLLEQLSKLPNIKFCISSRPEPVFVHHLGRHRQLRMQALTRYDMHKYCHDHLKAIVQDEDMFERMTENVLSKADGVFLWVVLAVANLERGAVNGDSPQLMEERLEKLPSGLFALYKNMWDRLNDDKDVYRQQAATYLNTVLNMNVVRRRPPVIQELVLAEDATLLLRSLSLEEFPTRGDTVDQRVPELRRRIQVQSAGLLEASSDVVKLVHRSAIEFLRETEEGAKILKHDPLTWDDHIYRLCMACLANEIREDVFIQTPTRLLRNISDNVGSFLTGFPWGFYLQSAQIDEIVFQMSRAYSRVWKSCHVLPPTFLSVENVKSGDKSMQDFNGVLSGQGHIERLATILYRDGVVSPVSSEYLLYLVECLLETNVEPEFKNSMLTRKELRGRLSLLLDICQHYGLSFTATFVRRASCTTPSKLSFRRSALTMILDAWLYEEFTADTFLFDRLISSGSNGQEKIVVCLRVSVPIQETSQKANPWFFQPLDVRRLNDIWSESQAWQLILETDSAFVLRCCARRFLILSNVRDKPQDAGIAGLEASPLWDKLAAPSRPRVLFHNLPETAGRKQGMYQPSEPQQNAVVECLMQSTENGTALCHGPLRDEHQRMNGLFDCLKGIQPVSSPVSLSEFKQGLISRGHAVRRRDGVLSPLPPDILTGREMDTDLDNIPASSMVSHE